MVSSTGRTRRGKDCVVRILCWVTTPRDPIQPAYYRDHHTLADLLFADALELEAPELL